jgi:hypothetical protein
MHLVRVGARVGLIVIAVVLVVACSGGSAASTAAPGRVSAEQPAVGDSGGNGASQPQASPAAQPQALAPDGRLIVYTGSMVLEVAELRPAIDQAQGIVVGLGGHLAGSSLESSADRGEYATVTYRIPAARWSEALQTLRALGARVVNESTDSEDVSE